MFTKTMTFDDVNGDPVTQTFYFNFNKKEIAELIEFGAIQKFADPDREYMPLEEAMEKLQTPIEVSGLTQVENNRQAYAIFENLVLDAYGIKGEDNVSFEKSKELREYWSNHVAYPELIFELILDPKMGAQFIENCLPPRMVAKAKEEMQAEAGDVKLSSETLSEMVQEAARRQEDPATRVEKAKKVKDLTPEDIAEMDQESFKRVNFGKLSDEARKAAFKRKLSS